MRYLHHLAQRLPSHMKVSIIIAVLDEARTVAALLERVWEQPLPGGAAKEMVIVESNSRDGSREIVGEFLARRSNDPSAQIRVVFQDVPRGKGCAIREGIDAATGDILLIQDADLEYDVADYPDLLNPILEGRTAFVLGSRHMGSEGWKIRKFANSGAQSYFMNLGGMFFHALFNLMFASRLTDPTSMYKVFRADCLKGLDFTCNRFDFDYELLGKLIRAGFYPLEVPVSYKSRGFHDGKKIRVFRDPPTWIAAILKSRFAALGAAGNDSRGAARQCSRTDVLAGPTRK